MWHLVFPWAVAYHLNRTNNSTRNLNASTISIRRILERALSGELPFEASGSLCVGTPRHHDGLQQSEADQQRSFGERL